VIRWIPAEVDVSIRPGWFYHPREDKMVKSLPHLIDIYFGAVGGNAVLLFNIPPDRRGLIHENDAERLMELKRYLEQTFSHDIAVGAKTLISSEEETFPCHLPSKGCKGNGVSYSKFIEYDLGSAKTFNLALLQEDIRKGQRVEEFYLDIWDGGTWKPIARGTTIGYKKILRFSQVSSQKVRIRITQSRLVPFISNFSLYFAHPVK
jgi:alpha-L-fucosidase